MFGLGSDILKKHYLKKVTSNGLSLKDVPMEHRTISLCSEAVYQNSEAMKYVPHEIKSEVERKADSLAIVIETAKALDTAERRKCTKIDSAAGSERQREFEQNELKKSCERNLVLADVNDNGRVRVRRRFRTPTRSSSSIDLLETKAVPQNVCKIDYIRKLLDENVSGRDKFLQVQINLKSKVDEDKDDLELNIIGEGFYGAKTPSRRIVVALECALRSAGVGFSIIDNGWDSQSQLRQVEVSLA
ncbi:hypothetical protein [Vibrio sp. D431a]|uniref:hypothetical protein n=1 Tax=Vibrio sp. D431a TaxID=2837388 RepID=UPI00255720F4|nr:hypothetical protein [Vibrio sp. D431a]MDK9789791.1 hypothetical protein [Vibrio sp. D431a]